MVGVCGRIFGAFVLQITRNEVLPRIPVESGGGAVPSGSGASRARFRVGVKPASHRSVSTSCSPYVACQMTHRTGRADFPHPAPEWDHAPRTRSTRSRTVRTRDREFCVAPASRSCTGFTRVAPLRRAVRPVHAQTASRLLAPRAGRWIRRLAGFPWGVVHSGVSMQHRRRDDRAREAGACATRSRAEHAEGADRSASGGMARALDAPPGAAGASGEAAHCTR